MITVIRNHTLSDIRDAMHYLLDNASKSFEVRQHAIEITSEFQDKISAVYDWVKGNISYIPDPVGDHGDEIELFISPVKMVEIFSKGLRPAGDCDDHALLNTALYRALGMQSNIILLDSGNGIDHAYCKVKSIVLNRWVAVDTTADVPLGWTYKFRKEIVI